MTASGWPQLFTEKCSTCIFHPGNRMHLADGRLRDLVEQNRSTGSLLICHKTLPEGDHPELGQTMCRGYFDAYGAHAGVAQIMARRFGPRWYVEVPPPED